MPGGKKFSKQQKGKVRGMSCKGTFLYSGSSGIKAVECARITSSQLESVISIIKKKMNKDSKLRQMVFPDCPVSKKPIGVRMGSGKGDVEFFVAKVQAGRNLFELDGFSDDVLDDIVKITSSKLQIKVRKTKLGKMYYGG
jgi:large subunit ribosomal protein L16